MTDSILLSAEHSSDLANSIIIRTSDRLLFKRCRRQWGWLSPMKMGLLLREQADYFWFGSGVHYALEDYHGYNRYGHPGKAFLAFVEATRKAGTIPSTWQELAPVGVGILSYYADYWLPIREAPQTIYVDGIPQVEVHAFIDLGVTYKGKKVLYGGTIDRVVTDVYGQLWIVEYKTAKTFRVFHYDTDEQITAYCWMASKIYGQIPTGVIYQQFKKAVPVVPRILSKGTISTDERQPTTAALYRKGLLEFYGDMANVPARNIKFLNALIAEEDEDKDRFIIRDRVERNQTQLDRFEERVRMELEDILNENLPLYPNQNKDCAWSCPLQHVCVAMEDGSDYEDALLAYVQQHRETRTEQEMKWRKHLPNPQDLELPQEVDLYKELPSLRQQPSELSPEERFLEELF